MIINKLITNIIFFFCLPFSFSSRPIYLSKIVRQNYFSQLCFFFFLVIFFFLCLLLRFVCQTKKKKFISYRRYFKKIKPTNRVEYMCVCVWIFRSFCYSFILDFFLAFLRFKTLSVALNHTHTYIKSSLFFVLFLSFRKILCFPRSISLFS
jgi:hypothetical protein